MPFNSLFEMHLRGNHTAFKEKHASPFNSLFEMRLFVGTLCVVADGERLSILYLRCNSLPFATRPWTLHFQFSIWDAFCDIFIRCRHKLSEPFNSLFEMRPQNTKRVSGGSVFFQFSIWDAADASEPAARGQGALLSILYLRCALPRSLCPTPRRRGHLSILYLRCIRWKH